VLEPLEPFLNRPRLNPLHRKGSEHVRTALNLLNLWFKVQEVEKANEINP
jgi:hypothetical protein